MSSHRRVVWTVFVAAACLPTGCSPAPSAGTPGAASAGTAENRDRGAREATSAMDAGILKLKEYPPLPSPPGHIEYVRLLQERCGVAYEVSKLPAGVAEADFIQEIGGWNDTMVAAITRKHGVGIFEELRAEAHRRWRERVHTEGER